MKDARILSVLADISQPLPALNAETLFTRFPLPPRNLGRDTCICCFAADCYGDDVLCSECDAHLRGPV